MVTRKRLKTKFDYQIRTFGVCALLLFAFTILFVSPQVNKENENNNNLQEEIKREESLNDRLKYEQEEIVIESTIKED